jgi:ABC-type branched-subunit amino acid transport system substrate-binding protein
MRFLCQALFLCSLSSAANVLHIGGLFSVFDDKGNVNIPQLQHASAFLQAVAEINNNSAILPNHELKVVMGTGGSFFDLSASLQQMFQIGSSFVGAVSGLDDSTGSFATKLFAQKNSMIVSSMTTDSSFRDSEVYPLSVRTTPLVSFQAQVNQATYCSLNLTRVAIFIVDDYNGLRFSRSVSDGTYCQMKVLGEYRFPADTTDFSDIFVEAMKVEARLFIIYIPNPVTVRHFLEQGYDAGLFRSGAQVSMSDVHGLDAALSGLPDARVNVITKGILSLRHAPDYYVYASTRGLQFYNSWVNQTSLGNCSTQTDAAGNQYLRYRTEDGKVSCASLNFASYKSKASSMEPTAVLSYDGAYALAWGLHYAIQKGLSLTGHNLSNTIIDDVVFVGASGKIDFFEGAMESNHLFGRGNRKVGNVYAKRNFHYSLYKSKGDGFATYYYSSPGLSGFLSCPKALPCTPSEGTYFGGWKGGYPPYAFDTAPAIVKIGGLFSAFVDGGSLLDKENAEFLSMFLMAVQEINNKTDGVHDDLLPNTQLKFSVVNSVSTALSGATAYSEIKDSFFHRGVSGIVNTLSSELVESINAYAVNDESFQVLSAARDAALGDGLQYSFKSSTVPLHSFIGTVFQGYLCSNTLQRIAVLFEDSSFGSRATSDLLNTGDSACSFEVLSSISFPATTTDFSSILDEVAKTGARVFVILAGPAPTATLLVQGRQRKLFASGRVVLTSESVSLVGELQSSHQLNDKAVSFVLKGVISANFFPDYGAKHTSKGESFVQRFLKFGSRRLGKYSENCRVFDDSASRLLLRNTDTGKGCAELNYSSYLSGEVELGSYAAMTYDATYALAWAIHKVLSASKPLTGETIRDAMFDSVDFEGVSGGIDITRGTSSRVGDNQGNRVSGVHYRLLNFNGQVYAAGGGESSSSSSLSPTATITNASLTTHSGFAVIGLWSVEGGIEPCPGYLDCHEPVYDHTPSDISPNDSRHPKTLTFSKAIRTFFFVLGGAEVFVAVMFLVLTIHFRDLAEVQNSQESLLYCILLGGLLAGGRVINSSLMLSDQTCEAGFWLSNLSYWLPVMAFFLKSWRVNRLLAIRSIKRVRITTPQIMSYMFLSVLFMVGMLVVLSVVGQPHLAEKVTVNANQETRIPYCGMVHPEVQTVLYIIHALLLGTGLRLCWSLREVPKKFSDFHTIGSGLRSSPLSSLLLTCPLSPPSSLLQPCL